jgi:hypothetical protein
MPFRVACPHCGSASLLPDDLLGKPVRCSNCRQAFAVKPPAAQQAQQAQPAEAAPAAKPRKPAAGAARSGIQAHPGRAAPPRRPEPAPAAKRRPASPPPPRPKPKRSALPWLLAAGAAGLVLLVVGTAGLAWLLLTPSGEPARPDPDVVAAQEPPPEGQPPAAAEEGAPAPPAAEVRPPAPAEPPGLPAGAAKAVKRLPSTVASVVNGGGGRFLILHLPQHRQIGVFDARAGNVVKYLPAPEDNVKIAACQDKLIVFAPAANVLQRYSLQTLEREVTAPSPITSQVEMLLMGSASRGPLLLFTTGENFHGEAALAVDPYTLRELPGAGPRGRLARESFWRLSGDGRVLTSYQPNLSPQGHVVHVWGGKEYKAYGLGGDPAGSTVPGPEGRYVYTARGLYTSEGKPVGKMGGYGDGSRFCLPAAEGEAFYLNLDVPGFPHGDDKQTGRVYLHLAGDDRPVAELTGVETPPGLNTWGREPFGVDRRYHLVPSAKLLVYLPPTNDRLELHRVDVEALLSRSPRDYLVVLSRPPAEAVPGQVYAYTPAVKSKKGGVRVKLESGPDGMRVTPDGRLTWAVPADYAEKETHVILGVSDASGQETFHTFKLLLTGR